MNREDLDISDVLSINELLMLEPYLKMHTADVVTVQAHNDAVIEAYLLGKIERENDGR